MAFSLIAHAAAGETGGAGVTTSAIDTTGADLVVVVASQYAGRTAATVTDSKSNTWSSLTARSGSVSYVRIWYFQGGTVGGSHTFSLGNGGTTNGSICVAAFSGSTATPFDVENGANVASGNASVQAGSITPSQANELIIAGLCSSDNTTTQAIDSSFTKTDGLPWSTGQYEGAALAYLFQGAAAAVNPTWTIGGTTSFDQSAAIASFKGSGGASFTAKFRKTLSGIGGRVGSRQAY